MKRTVTLTEERFAELMEAAHVDGYDDATRKACSDLAVVREDLTVATSEKCAAEDYPSSVTKDTLDVEIKKARNA